MEAEPKFHLSQPPELFSRIDVEPEVDPFGENLILTTIDIGAAGVNWGRKNATWPMSFGLCVLRDRDDVDDRLALRHFALRCRGDVVRRARLTLMIIAGTRFEQNGACDSSPV